MRRIALASTLALAAGCASAPKDAGFAEVRRTVLEETRQPVEWDPAAPFHPPDDGLVGPQLQEELTVERAVQVAFSNNRDVQATLEGLGIARADLLAAGTIRNPLFHIEVRFPGDPSTPVEMGLAQTLIDIFQLKNRKRMGRARFEAARMEVGGAIVHFAGQVRTDYFDLLAARRILARQETILKAQEAATELALRQHSAGNISDLDLENEQSRYEQVKLDHARAQLDELQARERLIADLGLVQRTELKLPDDFPAPDPVVLTPEMAEQQALARRLDVRIAQSEVEAARRAVPIAKTAILDELELGGHHEREPDGRRTTGPELTGPIPIFDRGTAHRTRARALLRQAQQRLAASTVAARSEARSALERLREARARMDYLHDVVVPRRERILRLTQLEYNAMLRGVFPLIEARQELARAQREEILAERDYWVSRTALDTALLGVGGFSVHREARQEGGRE
jgi:cobalt-zinc-cadmium efflux system outer membrane protein